MDREVFDFLNEYSTFKEYFDEVVNMPNDKKKFMALTNLLDIYSSMSEKYYVLWDKLASVEIAHVNELKQCFFGEDKSPLISSDFMGYRDRIERQMKHLNDLLSLMRAKKKRTGNTTMKDLKLPPSIMDSVILVIKDYYNKNRDAYKYAILVNALSKEYKKKKSVVARAINNEVVKLGGNGFNEGTLTKKYDKEGFVKSLSEILKNRIQK